MKRLALCLALFALGSPASALALNDPGDGGGGYCYWTWDLRWVCMP